MLAVIAFKAGTCRTQDHHIAGLNSVNSASDLFNNTASFVSDYNGLAYHDG